VTCWNSRSTDLITCIDDIYFMLDKYPENPSSADTELPEPVVDPSVQPNTDQSWKLKRPPIQLRPHHFWIYTSNLTTVVNSVLKFMISGTTSIETPTHMSIKINRLEEGHNSYPLVCRRPAETVTCWNSRSTDLITCIDDIYFMLDK
jgi:hypothetical protein